MYYFDKFFKQTVSKPQSSETLRNTTLLFVLVMTRQNNPLLVGRLFHVWLEPVP
jgi:hypothetical protein